MTVSTGKCYTQMNASSVGTFLNDCLRLVDCLTEVTAGSGSTVHKMGGATYRGRVVDGKLKSNLD